ncbi:MAG: nucleotide exchange factor GrpE, partial [Oscillospiraceae bacterium]|nr:nucleotide exchange factor GrpE [Oscillospiraceae bacterium]
MAKAHKNEKPDAEPPVTEPVEPSETEVVDAPDAPTAEELLAAERDRYLRLAAEYDNFRKRSQKERESLYTDVRAEAVAAFLPVYDNLSRALKTECADEAFLKGIELTMAQLEEILQNLGVEAIPAVGERLDPLLHNAVHHIEDPGAGEQIITEEFARGFTLNGKVIR